MMARSNDLSPTMKRVLADLPLVYGSPYARTATLDALRRRGLVRVTTRRTTDGVAEYVYRRKSGA
jgi:hypothetical protein